MTASTVVQYLAALPADRRAALSAVRKVINENLPDGYEEGMQFGMIGWYVPLSVYPAGYGENPKVPLSFVALASQKSGMVLHFLCFYGHPTLSTWFTSEYKKSGKKLDMGKGCVRFKSLEDLALDVRVAFDVAGCSDSRYLLYERDNSFDVCWSACMLYRGAGLLAVSGSEAKSLGLRRHEMGERQSFSVCPERSALGQS